MMCLDCWDTGLPYSDYGKILSGPQVDPQFDLLPNAKTCETIPVIQAFTHGYRLKPEGILSIEDTEIWSLR